jgi:hypothetical protein
VIRRCPAPMTAMVAALVLGLGSQPNPAHADGISSSSTAGTAEYTLTTTTSIPVPTVPVPGTVFSLTGTVTSGSSTLGVSNTSQLAAGDAVSGAGIPSGDTISQNPNGSGFTLSQPATASASGTLTFTSVPSPQIIADINPAGGVVTPATTSAQGPLAILAGSHGFNTSDVWDFLASGTGSTGQPLQGLGLSFYGQGLAAGGVLNFSLNVSNVNDPPQIVSQTNGVTIGLVPTSSTTDSSSSSSSSTSSSSSSTVSAASNTPEPLSLLLWSALAGAGLLRARTLRRANRLASDG